MKLVLALLAAAASALGASEQWRQETVADFSKVDVAANFASWKKAFEKKYTSIKAEVAAFGTFAENWAASNQFNLEPGHSYKRGVNQFTDMTGAQFRKYIMGSRGSCIQNRGLFSAVNQQRQSPKVDAPTSIDWTNVNGKSYVTAVKNQGQCGSCWSFSTTGAIESRSAILNGVTGDAITTLSEQQLMDCSWKYGNRGCDGGLMDSAFKYVESNGGLCSEKEYPYTAKSSYDCTASTCGTQYYPISTHTDVKVDSEPSLVDAVAAGPVSVAIEADQTAFQHYKSGVLTGECGDALDHGVLVVGYGAESGQDFWKVKNSWGETWGEQGYIKLCRNCNKNRGKGECGILMTPSYPTAKSSMPQAPVAEEKPDAIVVKGFFRQVIADIIARMGGH